MKEKEQTFLLSSSFPGLGAPQPDPWRRAWGVPKAKRKNMKGGSWYVVG